MKPTKVGNVNDEVGMKTTGAGMKDHEENLIDGFCFYINRLFG